MTDEKKKDGQTTDGRKSKGDGYETKWPSRHQLNSLLYEVDDHTDN